MNSSKLFLDRPLQFVSVLLESFLEENYVQKTNSYQYSVANRKFVAF